MVYVKIIPCDSYKQSNVDKAVRIALKDFEIKKNKTVFIKPNLLGAYRKGFIVITNPSVVEAICKILSKNKNKIIIGDSSFQNTELAIQKSGLKEVAKKYNAKLINLERTEFINIKIPKGKILKEVLLPKVVLDVDYIINVPKLKTHSLMKLTCGIKNMFGIIPGVKKQGLHNFAPTEEKFAQMLLDLNSVVKPNFTIVDAVIGMEGEGPAAGEARPTGLILASDSQFAVDLIACDIIGWDRKSVPTNRLALEQKLVDEKIDIIGRVPKIPYKKPSSLPVKGILNFVMNRIPQSRITLYNEKCIKCGACRRGCPMGAITLKPYPVIDTKKCIRCFCCLEVCPEHALYLKPPVSRKFIDWIRKKMARI
ncbi:MAG: DUF362 domain-containing protein [Candidatus Nanoarchaeia archaeon]|nr:DUF362 domain-containing protein [Candidatus Nanoarchaeia archaeon]